MPDDFVLLPRRWRGDGMQRLTGKCVDCLVMRRQRARGRVRAWTARRRPQHEERGVVGVAAGAGGDLHGDPGHEGEVGVRREGGVAVAGGMSLLLPQWVRVLLVSRQQRGPDVHLVAARAHVPVKHSGKSRLGRVTFRERAAQSTRSTFGTPPVRALNELKKSFLC